MAEAVVASLEHSLDDLYPVELKQEDPPTPIELANRISPWVKWNMKKALMANLHYEHQLYGPDNTYLNSVFPISRRFSVIPQALLRRVMARSRVNELNVSTGSSGGDHWSRNTQGHSGGRKFPDFMVVKVIPTPKNEPRKHYIVCVVEIKLGEEMEATGTTEKEVHDAENQMVNYMETLINHRYRVPHLRGYLLRGSKYHEFMIDGAGVEYHPGAYKDIFGPGDPLTVKLCQIAVQEWNRTSTEGVDHGSAYDALTELEVDER